jgi:diguanylate cyclase (GGDEF)-like protein/putative nucleotidyltransferase with HDIG domain
MSEFLSASAPPAAQLRLVRDATDRLSYDEVVNQAQQAELQGRRVEARELYEVALCRLKEAKSGAEASDLLRLIARTYDLDADLDLALDCADAALAVAEAHQNMAGVGEATNLLGVIRTRLGQLDEAERLYHVARESALRAGETRLGAKTAQNLGVVASIRGDLDTALHHYETSLAAYRKLGLASDVCLALNNLGLFYTQREEWAEAARCYEEALGVAEVLGDQSTRVRIEANRAECFVAQGEQIQAHDACERAMALSQQVKDTRVLGELHKATGIVAREMGDYARAEESLGLAQQIASTRQDLLLLAESTKERGELHRRQGRNREALQCLNRAHRLFSQLRARREIADVGRQMRHLESDFLDVVRRWGESIECKDDYTQGHCERVADIACALAARDGMDEQSLFWFRIGALLHDVGKLVIPGDVLNKRGPLTPDEWALMRQHPSAGVEMLADVDFPWDVRPIVEAHHERWDGAGYPKGLMGQAIPRVARILCIADVYDALTSERSYKRALSHSDAIDVMRLDVGSQFDPALFGLFEQVSNELADTWALPISAAAPRPAAVAAAGGAQHDELTGLPLRRAFSDAARRALAARERQGAVALLVIDVDHFKLINDTYGHLQGDEVLRNVAQTLRRAAPAGAFAARYAGDEFVLLLPGMTADAGAKVGEALRIAAHAIPVAAGRRVPVALTLSIGVAAAPEQGTTLETLFASADAGLYEAKRRGRDTVHVVGAPAGASSPVPQLDRFTGRSEERRRLLDLFERAMRGEPQLVSVVGEAGVGKTSLVRELAPEVRLRGGSLAVGRCVDSEMRPPYCPWASVMNAIRVLRVVPDRSWRELPRLVPALGGGAGLAHEGNRFALYEEVAEFLRLAAVSRPIVVLLDDMQWADGPSWDLLEYVAGRLDRERVLICVTIRDEDVGAEVQGRRARISRDERFHEVRVARLNRGELGQWLNQVLQQECEEELLDVVYKLTEGNPFFTVQVLRALMEEESLSWTGSRWEWSPRSALKLPTAVKDLISRRLTRLSPGAARTLSAVAVLGRTIDLDLAIAAGIATEDELLDAIDEGMAVSVLEPAALRGDDRVSFTHGLLVEVLHEHVHPRRLRRLHERAADALAARPGASAGDVAAHYAAADLSKQAYPYALRAAERAAAVYAHREAVSFLELALRHAAPGVQTAEARMRLAELAESAGEFETAEQHAMLALDWFALQVMPAYELRCRRALVRIRGLRGEPLEDTCTECVELLATAEHHGLEDERIALLTMISYARGQLGDAEGAETVARECLLLAERHGDARLTATARMRVGNALLHRNPAVALEEYERAAALFTAADDVYGLMRAEINLGGAHASLGAMEIAGIVFERALHRARAVHSVDFAGLATLNLGAIALRCGRYDSARAHLEEAHRTFMRVEHEHPRLAALFNLAHLAREEGKLAEAAERYRAVVEGARPLGIVEMEIGALAGAGVVALASNQLLEARARAAEVEARLRGREGWWFQGRELGEALAIQLALRAGEAAAAEARFRGALAQAEGHDMFGAAWLTADYAGAVRTLEPESGLVDTLLAQAGRVEAHGLTMLSTRYAVLLDRARSQREAARAQSVAQEGRALLTA